MYREESERFVIFPSLSTEKRISAKVEANRRTPAAIAAAPVRRRARRSTRGLM